MIRSALRRIAAATGLSLAACAGADQPLAAPTDPGSLDALIAQHPGDDRVATWMVDRAIAELATLAPDGTDTSLLFGVVSAEARNRGMETARRALATLGDAGTHAQTSIKRLEEGLMGAAANQPDAARRAEAAEAALSRLVDVEQAQRIPYYRAVARTLLACSLDGAARNDAARAAVSELSALSLAAPAAEAARRVVLVAAMLSPGIIDASVQSAVEAELRWIDAAASDAADELTRARSALAKLLIQTAAGDLTAMPPSTDLSQAEAVARALLIKARLEPARRNQFTAAACEALLQAGRADTQSPSPSGERLRLYAKIAAIIEPGVDAAALPAEASLARAISLLRTNADSLEARALLDQLAQRRDVTEFVRAEVIWEMAAIGTRSKEPGADIRAAQHLHRFLTECPRDDRAFAAARSLDAIVERIRRTEGAELNSSRREEIDRMQLVALETLLSTATSGDEPRADWRARWISIRTRALDPRTVGPEELAPLMEMDERGAGEPMRPSGATVALAELFRRVLADPDWSGRPAEVRLALIRQMRRARDVPLDERLPLLAAEAALEAGRPGAVEELRALVGGPLDQPDQPTRARLRLALAGTLKASPSGRTEGLALLRELTAPYDEAPSSIPRPGHYWQAWALTLELLQLDNADGSRSEAIRSQAKRLELLDPTLGGSGTAERIRRIRDAAAAK